MTERNLLAHSQGLNRCVRAREGYVLYNPNDIYVGQSIERYGEWSELEADLLRQLCTPGAVVIEAGSNIGTLTLVLARGVGPTGFVYAYEPQRIVFQTLCANLALNSIVNVDARHAAVGAEPGWIAIPDIDYSYAANYSGLAVGHFGGGRKVPVIALDDDLELDRLDLIKIDVEGAELEVLLGAESIIDRFRPPLYLENDRIEKSATLIQHLFDLEYRLYWHLPPLYNPHNFFGNPENEFAGIMSVNMLCLPRARDQNILGLSEIRDPAEHPLRAAGPAAGGGSPRAV